jgi:hypothetical protein
MGTYQRKCKKENSREITFDTRHYRRAEFKELLGKLLLSFMAHANYTHSWVSNIISKMRMNLDIRYYHH